MKPPPAWRLSRHDTLPSTSDFCIAAAEAGEPEGLAVLARTQSHARGSRGRSWSEASGTFALSVLLRPDPGLDLPALWPFLAAVAFHQALGLTLVHEQAIRLKWPNDVMLDERKLGGILIERGVLPEPQAGWLVIGFGANLAASPEIAERRAACLAELGAPATADAIAGRLLDALSFWITQAARGFRPVRDAWLERAHPPGTALVVRMPEGQTAGRFSSVAEDGALLLSVAGEVRRFSTGEILLLRGR